MTVTALPVRDEYTASAGQTVFNYSFLIFSNQDLNVYITPVGQPANDSTDLTTAYTVDTNSIGDRNGGFITLSSGVNDGDLVTIVSSIVDERTTDYQNSGDFLPDTVNDDFDRVVSITKQQEDRSGRTLAFPESLQNATDLTLPIPNDGNFLRWKTDLTGLENVTLSSSGITAEVSVNNYAALRALTSSTYSDGQVIFVTNDGVSGTFVVKTGTVTDDGGTLIVFTDDSNRYAERTNTKGIVNIRWFGTNGTMVGDSAACQAAVDSGAKLIWLDPSESYFLNDITLGSDVTISSSAEGAVVFADTKVSTDTGFDVSMNVFNADGESHITIENIILDGSVSAWSANNVPYTELESPLEISNCSYVVERNLRFRNTLAQAATDGTRNQNGKRGMIYNLGCSEVLIEHCEVEDSCYIEGFINYDCTNVVVQNNYTKQERSSHRISSPIVVTGLNTENVLIKDNIWIGHGGSGLNLVVRRNCKVLDNFINGRGVDFSNEAGYAFTEGMRDVLVQGNTIDFTDQSAAVSGYISNSVKTGIAVQGTASYFTENVKILDNIVTSFNRNIRAEHCTNVLIQGNTSINAWQEVVPTADFGRSVQSLECIDSVIIDNYINGAATAEFGIGTYNISVENNTNLLVIKNNTLFEVEDHHINLDSNNDEILIEGNSFNHDVTTPVRNVFAESDASTGLVQKNNYYKRLSGTPNSVDFNTAYSSAKFAPGFEYYDVLEIADDEAYQLPFPINNLIFEMSSDNSHYSAIQVKDIGTLDTVYLSSNVTKTTGALTGTTGVDTELTLSVTTGSIYIENRTGSTVYMKVQTR